MCVCVKKFVEEGFIVLLLFTWKMSRGGTTRESEAALQGNFLAFEVLFLLFFQVKVILLILVLFPFF